VQAPTKYELVVQNATVEYHWLAGQYDRLPSLMADLVRRRVAVIATPGSNPAVPPRAICDLDGARQGSGGLFGS
jgi:hypothetical protein